MPPEGTESFPALLGGGEKDPAGLPDPPEVAENRGTGADLPDAVRLERDRKKAAGHRPGG